MPGLQNLVYLMVLGVSSIGTAASATPTFVQFARAAIGQYALSRNLDLHQADLRAFGFSLERHANLERVTVFDTATAGRLLKTNFICETEGSPCRVLAKPSHESYLRDGSLYSADHLLNALDAIVATMKDKGVDAETLTLFKIWQAPGGLHARIGFESHYAVEVSFSCDPTAATFCRMSTTLPPNEP